MSLEHMWAAYRRGATLDELRQLTQTAQERFYLAMLAHSQGDHPAALALAEQAALDDVDRVVYAETVRFLKSGATCTEDVYASPEPFTAFATGGGNVGLYRAAHQALCSVYAGYSGIRLLDIGCGEGHALLPALASAMDAIAEVDAVEPSRQRLALVDAELGRRGVKHRAYPCTVQEFTTHADAEKWDLVQETFALITLSRADRIDLFTWLRPRTARVALIEFDVPELGCGLEPARFRYLIDTYEQGLREYDGDRELVAQGFLVPVLLGTLTQTDQGHTEHPIQRWVEDLAAADFKPEPPRHVYDYWWAPAYLITAT
jgi:SAM-dependent methyltransferase